MSAGTRIGVGIGRAGWAAGALCLLLTGGCAPESGNDVGETAAAPEPAAADVGAGGAPRVYFVAPQDGATVGTAVHVMFEVENFEIEPVGDGMVHEGFGHHHLAIDGECLPPGEVIPTADPWIHFGDGTNMIDVTLTPGQHTLTLQIGDGEHRTLDEPGLCTTITVTVAEEATEQPAS